jgi:hypothetical protein
MPSGCFHLIKDFDLVGADVLCAVEILHGAAGEQQREEALALHLPPPSAIPSPHSLPENAVL